MENEVSSEFLACLRAYTKKSIIHRSFQAWRKYVMGNRRRYNKACMALEHWNFYMIKKYFNILKAGQAIKLNGFPYSKGIYFIILAAICFLPQKSIKSYGCRIDKLLSLFKQNNILNPNVPTLKKFVKSWENYLTKKYFDSLKKRWLLIKDFKNWRKKKTTAKCFNYFKKLLKCKKGMVQLTKMIKSHHFRQFKQKTQFQQVLGIKNQMALKFKKKFWLQRCFQILLDFTKWNRQNTDKLVLSKKFYALNLMMKSLTGIKIFIKSGAIQKNYKMIEKRFRKTYLLEKTFKNWKKYQLKKNDLKMKLDKYLGRKHLDSKKTFLDNWKWIYVSKVKLAYYTKLKLLEKSWKGWREMILKKQKVKTISRLSMSHSGKKKKLTRKKTDEMDDYLIDEKNDILDRILAFQHKRQNNLLRNSFKKWNRTIDSKADMRQLKIQAQLYKDISCYKSFFGVWRQRYSEKASKYKTRVLSSDFYETKTLKKYFQALKQNYLENLSERVKMFRASEFHEENLLKKTFLVLDTERKVYNLLCTKFYERYCEKTIKNCFDALLDFSRKERQIKRMIRGFRSGFDEVLIQKAFYYLKEKADFNLIKRRSNKLAQIVNKKRLFTKAFKAFKLMKKVHKKAMLIKQRKDKKIMKNLYLLWRVRFREERKVKKVANYQANNKLARIFENWKKYSARKKTTNSIVQKFAERRNDIYLRFIWEIWRKIISLSHQKNYVGQALFISYVYNFKKQVLHGWKSMVKKLQYQRQIQSRLSTQKNEDLVIQYFGIWMKRSEGFRGQTLKGIEYKNKKQENLINKAFKSWAAMTKERVIKNRLLSLWEEKMTYKSLANSFRAWSIYTVGRNTREKIVNVKSQFSELQTQKRVFYALQFCVEKRKREKARSEQIKNAQAYRILDQYFYTWCEEFKDLAFERAGEELIDKYRKIMCFRLFQRKIEETKEIRNYGTKLDQFALEIYKRKSFITFSQNASRLADQRKRLEESASVFLRLRRKKAFGEFKQIIKPCIQKTRANYNAMKLYILKLYFMSFKQWKLYIKQQGRLQKTNEEVKERQAFDWKEKFIENLSEVKHHRIESRERSPELKEEEKIDLKRNVIKGWKNQNMESDKKKYTLANVLFKVYMKALGNGFTHLQLFYLKKKKLELCFDEIHEKYITKLLKKHYDTWKTEFVFHKLAANNSDGENW